MPDMAIGYITRKDKAKYIDVQNLFIDEDYSAQFKETAARFGKYTDYDERKYYHFKLSLIVQTTPIRLGYKSTPKRMRKKPSPIVSA